MFKYLKNKRKTERAGAALIEVIFMLPLLVSTFISIVDIGLYFNNRAVLQALTRDGARTVAVFGGDGTHTEATTIEVGYGDNKNACGKLRDRENRNLSAKELNRLRTTGSGVECDLGRAISIAPTIVSAEVTDVYCGLGEKPKLLHGATDYSDNISMKVGKTTGCMVKWTHKSLPLSFMNLLPGQTGPDHTAFWDKDHPPLSGNLTEGTGVTEVGFANEVGLIPR